MDTQTYGIVRGLLDLCAALSVVITTVVAMLFKREKTRFLEQTVTRSELNDVIQSFRDEGQRIAETIERRDERTEKRHDDLLNLLLQERRTIRGHN